MRLTTRGGWPGILVMRQGWALAEARPWNDDIPDASLRLRRGSARFLEACVEHLLAHHVGAVFSPPLSSGSTHTWRRAGFTDHIELELYRRHLDAAIPEPQLEISRTTDISWSRIVAVDREAFDRTWRMNVLGLEEAFSAVSTSTVLTVEGRENGLAGYAIVGVGSGLGYLQRIAVIPGLQRRGIGRALVRECLRWARSRGGRAILLNTQADNLPAITLYTEEGFVRSPDPLHVLRSVPGSVA